MKAAKLAAKIYLALNAVVCLFQLALALGAPWGAAAWGGAYPGQLPPAMRLASAMAIFVLAFLTAIVAAQAELGFARAFRFPRWALLAPLAIGLWSVLGNMLTSSGIERITWLPVSILQVLACFTVAASPSERTP
ncbi:MAG: hypothetical protein KGO53_05835 [Alphaproteobacteria bacterium]|nr:hypothetical protein [Alphaproteobacteria bacterium]